ncbi:alpha/beta hydrolase [Ornithinibacillus halotolerans]|uniref:Alpha/beta hydrolase n=1 Tax=Ornithinibacillus halotolerans TaxID=1274357 RepID=A0A916S5M1_9BACI|nr:alpha/beta fold hydrolase [Ornithinibacillus halotolerans]GGA85640.1 alpha/beta hydrolase [Ornithinibacillus halotolerans]
MKKKIIKIVASLFIVLLIIDIIASFYFYDLAISRGQKDFLSGNKDLEVSADTLDVLLEGGWRDWVSSQDFEKIEMTSRDGLTLQGYFLEAKEPTNTIVIGAHGYLGRGSDMGLYGQYYYEELGYHFFTADSRGHGRSEGEYYGFGWPDRLDYVDWINLLIEKLGPDTEIILHGLSMGAGTVLMTAGEKLPDNVKVVIADSPYTSVHDLFSYQIKRMFNLPPFPFIHSTSLVTKAKAGYSFKEASALEQVKKAEIPILYITGNGDTFVPTEMTHELYDNTNSEAEIVTFEGANHGESFVMYEEKYIEVINEFLEKYMVE